MRHPVRYATKFRCKVVCLFLLLLLSVFLFARISQFIVRRRKVSRKQISRPYWRGVGFCRNGMSLLDFISDASCVEMTCFFSKEYGVVNLLSLAAGTKPFWSSRSSCQQPRGGQLASVGRDVPQVSFIFTFHNSPDMACRALMSAFRVAHETESAEYIIVNDASSASIQSLVDLVSRLRTVFGVDITLIYNRVNLGYGASNNLAMRRARGKYIVLLNSDVMLRSGCLSLLLWTIETSTKVGIVGPLMLNAKGFVQEAGGHLFQHGVPGNYGRGHLPLDLPLKHARDVDYVSAACLLARRDVLEQVGYFDPIFEPAYFEDTDLAMTVLKHGFRVMLQPLSVVEHIEGFSIDSHEKSVLMARNQQRFTAKHDKLVSNYCPNMASSGCKDMSLLDAMTTSSSRRHIRVLYLEDIVPQFDRDSGSIRTLQILKILVSFGFEVTYEPRWVDSSSGRYIVALFAYGVNFVAPGTFESIASSALTCPWSVIFVGRRDIYRHHLDCMMKICPTTPVIYDTVDVHFIRESREFNLKLQDRINSNQETEIWSTTIRAMLADLRKIELDLMERSSVTLVVSPTELVTLKEMRPNIHLEELSNIYPVTSSHSPSSFSDRSGAIFVGNMCHTPNSDALEFIIDNLLDVVPLEKFVLHVVASRTKVCPLPSRVESHPNVVVYRDISDADLRELHKHVKFLLAPLRYGAGVKGKVNFALLHGVPVIVSDIAIEGMFLSHGVSALKAATPQEYVSCILALSTNETLWKRLSEQGLQVMKKHFSVDVAKRVLRRVFSQLQINTTLPTTRFCEENFFNNPKDCSRFSFNTKAMALTQKVNILYF